MRSMLGKYALKNLQSKAIEDAELYSPIDSTNLADFDQHWKPEFIRAMRQAPRGTSLADLNLQDAHWDWNAKAAHFGGRIDYKSFAIECASMTQGLMLCSLVHMGREPSQHNQHIVYIEYLHTAPWNRETLTPTPLYAGVGKIFVATAISLSRDEQFKGRIGLHSLPQSDAFYRDRCGMTDLGPDPNYPMNLRYFEMTEAQATRFVK